MMPASYIRSDGGVSEVDLDRAVDVIDGWSEIEHGWQGFIIYSPDDDRFIELMSTVPDVRGNSDSRSVEVDAEYIEATYGLTSSQIANLRRSPSQWEFIKQR